MVGGLGWYIAKKISSVQARLIKKKKKVCTRKVLQVPAYFPCWQAAK